MKAYVAILNMKHFFDTEKSGICQEENTHIPQFKLSKLEMSTSFLIISGEIGSILLVTRVPIILLEALLIAWTMGLLVGEGDAEGTGPHAPA